MATSSKEWKDFNVDKAFGKLLHVGLIHKYGEDFEDSYLENNNQTHIPKQETQKT